MSDLLDLYRYLVEWVLSVVDQALDSLGLEGGLLERLNAWLSAEAVDVLAALIGAVVLALWTMTTAGLASWADRRMLARAEGRVGPRHVGLGGSLQGLSDWVKLMVRRPATRPSAAAGAVSGALVLGSLSLLALGPWARLADPSWGLLACASMLAMAPLPMAAALRGAASRRHHLASTAATSTLLMLAVASVALSYGSWSSSEAVSVQTDVAWGALLSPVGLVALVYVMVVEAGRMRTARGEGVAGAPSPGPQTAIARYAVAARYYGLAVLGSVLFLGGWSGPGPDGFWWTIVKAFALLAVTSYIAGAVPRARPIQVASSVRLVWLPVAALNLVVVAALLEVLG